MEDEIERAVEIVKWLREEAKHDTKLAAAVEAAVMFGELQSHPVWKRLYEAVKAQKAGFMSGLAARLLRKPEEWGDIQREVTYMQGFFQGAYFVLSCPEFADSQLHRAAERAYERAQQTATEEE